MRKCRLNPDEDKKCSCLVVKKRVLMCDVYDEPIKTLKVCALRRTKKS